MTDNSKKVSRVVNVEYDLQPDKFTMTITNKDNHGWSLEDIVKSANIMITCLAKDMTEQNDIQESKAGTGGNA